MSERPKFFDDLERQLDDAASRMSARRRRNRTIGMVGATVALVVAAGLGLARADMSSDDVAAVAPETTNEPPKESEIQAPDSSTEVGEVEVWEPAASSIGGEARPPVFWTGSEVVELRTENRGLEVIGERWDPATNTVERIAPSGLSWRVGAATIWTGTEVLVVGGSSGPELNQIGAAYNPADDTWRDLRDPPGDANGRENWAGGPAVWTGNEMLMWRSALAFDPASDTWRSIAESPLSQRVRPVTVWTGSELMVWGGCADAGVQCDETNTGLLADGAIYDPSVDQWKPLPESTLGGATHMVADWTGSEVVVLVTEPAGQELGMQAAAFDPESMSWRTLPTPKLDSRRYSAATWSDGRFVVWGGRDGLSGSDVADGAAYDPVGDQWTLLPPGPGPARSLHTMIDAGDRIYISSSPSASPPLQLRLVERQEEPPAIADPQAEMRRPVGTRLDLRRSGLQPRGGHSVVWTGSEMIIWGGSPSDASESAFADGAAFDLQTGSWRTLSQSPLAGRANHAALWTGEEMIVASGELTRNSSLLDAAAYNPATDTWRLLASIGSEHAGSKFGARGTWVWTDDELVLWSLSTDAVVSYDPAIDDWRDLPSTLLPDTGVQGALRWTGKHLVALSDDGPLAAATFEPGVDTAWQPLPSIDYIDPFPINSAVAANTLIVWARSGREVPTYRLDIEAREWVETGSVPVAPCEGHIEPLVVGPRILVMDLCLTEPPGGAAVYDTETGEWEELDEGADGRPDLARSVWTGSEVLVAETTCCFGAGGQPFEWSGTRYLIPD